MGDGFLGLVFFAAPLESMHPATKTALRDMQSAFLNFFKKIPPYVLVKYLYITAFSGTSFYPKRTATYQVKTDIEDIVLIPNF